MGPHVLTWMERQVWGRTWTRSNAHWIVKAMTRKGSLGYMWKEFNEINSLFTPNSGLRNYKRGVKSTLQIGWLSKILPGGRLTTEKESSQDLALVCHVTLLSTLLGEATTSTPPATINYTSHCPFNTWQSIFYYSHIQIKINSIFASNYFIILEILSILF